MNKRYLPLAAFFSVFVVFSTAYSEQQGLLPRFYLDYAVVQDSLKNDKGNFDEFMKLAEINRNAADFIAKFWWGKAKKECHAFVNEMIKQRVEQMTPDSTEYEKSEIEKGLKEDADQCYYGVYYDHWDEINQMVIQRHQEAISLKNK